MAYHKSPLGLIGFGPAKRDGLKFEKAKKDIQPTTPLATEVMTDRNYKIRVARSLTECGGLAVFPEG